MFDKRKGTKDQIEGERGAANSMTSLIETRSFTSTRIALNACLSPSKKCEDKFYQLSTHLFSVVTDSQIQSLESVVVPEAPPQSVSFELDIFFHSLFCNLYCTAIDPCYPK